VRLSTSRLNTPTGGPSIESKASVGPDVGAAVVSEALDSEAFDEVVSLQAATRAVNSTARAQRQTTVARESARRFGSNPST
jgi:hypothetical protein